MTRANKDLLRKLVEDHSLAGVLHQLAELCFQKDSEERDEPGGNPSNCWAHAGDELEGLSEKVGC